MQEANRLGILVAVVDSNANPDGVDYIVPGNDDAMRAITFYCELVKAAVLDGLQTELMKSGGDAGAAIEAVEPALAEMAAEEEVPAVDAMADDAAAEALPKPKTYAPVFAVRCEHRRLFRCQVYTATV